MAYHKRLRPADRRHGPGPRNVDEQSAALGYFNIAPTVFLQSKTLAARFGLSPAAALALAPLVYGSATR
jgi:hypothetical protein